MAENGNPFNLPTFRQEFSDVMDEKLKPIMELLHKHEEDIDRHEAAFQRARGAKWAFGLIWAALSIAWEWIMHSGGHK